MTSERSLDQIKGFLLDMDGTFFVSSRLMPHALDILSLLNERGIPFVFLTNNSSARVLDYQAKLKRLGVDVELKQVLTSGEATIRYLKANTPYKHLYLLGTPSLEEEFRDAGFTLTDRDPECVMLGFDKTLTYEKLRKACLFLADGIPYVATHPDYTCIVKEGLIPDTGAFISAIQTVTKREPKIIGKPYPEMVEAALDRLGTTAECTALVGDQLDTDMTMAQQSGLFGVLVLSGETSPERFQAQSRLKPDLVLDHIGKLYDLLKGLS